MEIIFDFSHFDTTIDKKKMFRNIAKNIFGTTLSSADWNKIEDYLNNQNLDSLEENEFIEVVSNIVIN